MRGAGWPPSASRYAQCEIVRPVRLEARGRDSFNETMGEALGRVW